MHRNINPRASLVLRKHLTNELLLPHQAIGDTMGLLLAETIAGLPFVKSINLADNKLTDVSLGPILRAIVHIPDLITLDISKNTIGPDSASSLSDYLMHPNCPLVRLLITQAGNYI